MTTVTHIAKTLQKVLKTKANELAWKTGFMERERQLTGSSFVVGLVSGWQADPQVSLAGLSQAVGNAGTPISRQGLAKRFTAEAAELLKAVLAESLEMMIKAQPISKGLLSRFTAIDLVDSSIITLPNELASIWQGSGGFGENASISALKLSVRWDICSGQLKTLEISNGSQHDRKSSAHYAPVEPASLQIRDLGYFSIDNFEKIGQQGAYWLTRYKRGVILIDTQGVPIELGTWLPQKVGEIIDCHVYLGKSKRLPCRLVAECVPEWVLAQRHERIREMARQNQTDPSANALLMAQWTIYLTNVPQKLLTSHQVFIVGRYRWQVELLFKLWKSDLQIDQWVSKNPYRILCEIYAKLIASVVTHWFLLLGCWHNPKHSLRQAMPTIHALAWQWANSLSCLTLLKHTLTSMQRALSRCQMDKSVLAPRHFQLVFF